MSMRSSSKPFSTTRSTCPRCGSVDVKSISKIYDGIGIAVRTVCNTCDFWVCNCAFKTEHDGVEFRGFMREGALPDDLPLPMKEDVVMWP